MPIQVVRNQHPVGQGFFHSGELSGDGFRFHYVYDCGAMTPYAAAKKREIKAYRRDLGKLNINTLFISHAHADHLNGVSELLKGCTRVETILLPHIDVANRLIAFARTASEDPAAGRRRWVLPHFIVNPVDALAGFGPDQIVQFEPSEGPAPSEPPDLPSFELAAPTPISGRQDQSWGFVGRGNISSGPFAQGRGRTIPVLRAPHTVAIAPRSGKSAEWLLAPYVDPGVASKRKQFVWTLAKRLNKSVPKLNADLAPVLLDTFYSQRSACS